MAVPSSGELELRGDIALEVYGSATGNNISLGAMSDLAGFSEPDSMSDFYGYVSAVTPSVTTNNISNIAETSLTINGNITSDGGATITERGFYFGTNSSSPTNNTKYTVGGTTGYYSNNRTGLSGSTTYYCWAFATNSKGTTYGSRVQATTIAPFTPNYVNVGYTQNSNVYLSSYGGGVSAQVYSEWQYLNPVTNSYVYRANCGSNYDNVTVIDHQCSDSWGSSNRLWANNTKNRWWTGFDYYSFPTQYFASAENFPRIGNAAAYTFANQTYDYAGFNTITNYSVNTKLFQVGMRTAYGVNHTNCRLRHYFDIV